MQIYDYICVAMSYSTIVIFRHASSDDVDVADAQQIEPELMFLCQKFERVIIVPTATVSPTESKGLPDRVELDAFWIDSRAYKCKWCRIGRFLNPELWRLTSGDRSVGSLKYASEVIALAGAIRRWIDSQAIELETTLFYAFRFDIAAGALGLLSESMPVNFFIRAHYQDFCRSFAPKTIADTVAASTKAIFASDEEGAVFLKNRFPKHTGKIDVELLGTRAVCMAPATHHLAADRRLTFLSVAKVTPEKRVDLNYKLLRALAVARPQTRLRWIHVGEGPLLESLRQLVMADNPSNLTVEFMELTDNSSMDNSIVDSLFQSEQVDWTMLLSEGEELPLSVCASLSYGVPVVGTMVRGVQEAIDDDCGLLLAADPEPEEFVRGILPYIESDYRMDSLRTNAVRRWRELFDADKLRSRFVERISKL